MQIYVWDYRLSHSYERLILQSKNHKISILVKIFPTIVHNCQTFDDIQGVSSIDESYPSIILYSDTHLTLLDIVLLLEEEDNKISYTWFCLRIDNYHSTLISAFVAVIYILHSQIGHLN